MTMPAQGIDSIVRVTSTLIPAPSVGEAFGEVLFITTDAPRANAVEFNRARRYATLGDVGADFDTDTSAYIAAQTFFAQDPYPSSGLLVGYWNTLSSAVASVLTGGPHAPVTTVVSTISGDSSHGMFSVLQGITSGNISFGTISITTLDLSAATDLDGVATAVQAALIAAGLTGIVVTYDTDHFVVTFSDGRTLTDSFSGDAADSLAINTLNAMVVNGTPGFDIITSGSITFQGIVVSGLDFSSDTTFDDIASTLQTAMIAAGITDVDVTYESNVFLVTFDDGRTIVAAFTGDSALSLGLDTDSDTITNGRPSDTDGSASIAEAMDSIEATGNTFYFVCIEQGSSGATLEALQRWVVASGSPRMVGLDINDSDALVTNEASSTGATLSATESPRTFLCYKSNDEYLALSVASRLSSVNFEGSSTIITPALKTFASVSPDMFSDPQVRELERKRINRYVRIGGRNVFLDGQTVAPGVWIDERFWLDWIVDAVQLAIFNALATSLTRLPATSEGIAILLGEIEDVCIQGISNGGIAPGQLDALLAEEVRTTAGLDDFDGFLTRGYLVYIGQLSERTNAQRSNRESPPINVWLKGSGAIQGANISLTFQG